MLCGVEDALCFLLPDGSTVRGLGLGDGGGGGGGGFDPDGPAVDVGAVVDVKGVVMEVGMVNDRGLASM